MLGDTPLETRSRSTKSVPALDRALSVLELLAQSRRGLSMSEISQRLSLPKSSTHLLLGTLEGRGYLQKATSSGRYLLGVRLINLSRTAIEHLGLVEEARPFLQALMHRTGLTVHFAIQDGAEVVLIDKIDSPGPYRITTTWVGRRVPGHCTGIGKALLAWMSTEDFRRQIASKALWRYNHKTICSIDQLARELEKVRSQGYALSDEESQIGFRGIGAAVFSKDGQAIAALSVDGINAQIPLEVVGSLGESVKRTAAAISTHLGFVKREDPL